MNDYFVREENGLIEGSISADTATDAALNLSKQLFKTPNFASDQEWLVFEVEIGDTVTRVSIQFEQEDDTLHFPDHALEPVETPLALTLHKTFQQRKENQNGRPAKVVRPIR